jgi:hypothetical protein
VLGWTVEPVAGTRLCPACSRQHLHAIECGLPSGAW